MHRVVLPSTISIEKKGTAVAELTFDVQAPQSQFRSVTIQNLKFMKCYEQGKFTDNQYPINETQFEWESYKQNQRGLVVGKVLKRDDIGFGHARNPELRALDELPHTVDIEVVRAGLRRDNINIGEEFMNEYQSVDTEKQRLSENNKSLQAMLVYSTNLIRGEYGGWEGTVSCSTPNVGIVNLLGQGMGNTFTIRVKMFDFKGLAMSSIPSVELVLLFR
jgi:hypothetical protein